MEKIQQQDLERPTSSNGRTFFTCEICVQIVLVNRQFKSMEMRGCLHTYCTDCVAKYIQQKVIKHNMSEIKCANPDCNVILDASLCQSALPNRVFEKWCRVLCESLVLLDSSKGGVAYGRSYCPFRDCSELILNECVRIAPSTSNNNCTSKITASNCPNCKKLFCFHCMVPWGGNHRCRRHETIIDIDSNDVLFMEMVKRKRLVRFPNCFRYVEHIEGCASIKCSDIFFLYFFVFLLPSDSTFWHWHFDCHNAVERACSNIYSG
ncbi:hypothetical protein MKW98_011329 [Papaver atlanticum]|uniref:RING-type domain-containing protein n=1 Tax=Papaver atlanticum TaxID=357466 RepID=A0AAD4SVB9_9MAGN|nr:hypothetical protein MKW98_011329 [Papaver atlanticum]